MDIGLILTIAGTVLAVVAFPATYYMGKRNRQRPDLCFVTDFDVLMSPEDGLAGGNLDLTIGNHRITRISRTYIAIFNKSGDSVRGSDIVKSDSLRIGVEDADAILQARIIASSRPQCGIVLKSTGSPSTAVDVSFDFLDAKDGAIIEVLHQGDNAASLSGTIRGAQFRDKGRAELTPSAIRTIAAKSWVARFNHFSKKKGFNRLSFALVAALPILAFTGIVISLTSAYLQAPSAPIPATEFDLSTLNGQKEFLTAASEAGIRSEKAEKTFPLLLLPLAGLGSVTIWFYYSLAKNRIPRTITQHIVDEEAPPVAGRS